jgi:hypothetical protein
VAKTAFLNAALSLFPRKVSLNEAMFHRFPGESQGVAKRKKLFSGNASTKRAPR